MYIITFEGFSFKSMYEKGNKCRKQEVIINIKLIIVSTYFPTNINKLTRAISSTNETEINYGSVTLLYNLPLPRWTVFIHGNINSSHSINF